MLGGNLCRRGLISSFQVVLRVTVAGEKSKVWKIRHHPPSSKTSENIFPLLGQKSWRSSTVLVYLRQYTAVFVEASPNLPTMQAAPAPNEVSSAGGASVVLDSECPKKYVNVNATSFYIEDKYDSSHLRPNVYN